MNTPPPTLHLENVLIEGMDQDRSLAGTVEVQQLLTPLTKVKLDLQHDVKLSIIITDRMEQHVDRIRAEYGFVDASPYIRTRHAVAAAGIMLADPGGPPHRISVVLHNEPWLLDDGESIVLRVYLLGHELGHVLQKGRSQEVSQEECRNQENSHAIELKRTAAILRDEFDADMTAENLCRISLRDSTTDDPIHPGAIFGYRFGEAACDLLAGLCAFSETVQDYRVTSKGLENLYPTAGPLVGELLLVLGHAVALYIGAEDLACLRQMLEKSTGFSEYIQPDWDDFIEALICEDSLKGETELVRIAESVLNRLGLCIEDLPGGVYMYMYMSRFSAKNVIRMKMLD